MPRLEIVLATVGVSGNWEDRVAAVQRAQGAAGFKRIILNCGNRETLFS
jgi:hypothetical protein